MAPPLVTIYVTSLTSAPKVRKHIDLLRRSLKGLEIPYEEYDLVIDEDAKKKWQRSKPPGMVIGLPGYLVGGEWVGTMDDFEDAVETQTLETFLKQDIDLSGKTPSGTTNTAQGGQGGQGGQKTIQEIELENLMNEMTNEDLDKLMNDLNVDESVGKIGLLSKQPEQSHNKDINTNSISDVKESDNSILNDLKSELSIDKDEDKLLKGVENDTFQDIPKDEASSIIANKNNSTNSGNEHTQSQHSKHEEVKGQGIEDMIEENDILRELNKELKVDKSEDRDLDEIQTKAKID
ncbi:uncharacterized protein L201_004717 [Kwoniella dendrophila CBS 6074]|uniref:Glutaredoxin domain-containing protein n=1 Tax=Kwoniella dendrophila CBS 6074 TaxID=1295534 RepID=A0AAX4JWL9_9TREE